MHRRFFLSGTDDGEVYLWGAILEERGSMENMFDPMERNIRTVEEYFKRISDFVLRISCFGKEEVGASLEIDHAHFFRSQKKCLHEVFFVFFCVDEYPISEVTTDEIHGVPKPCTRMPAGHAPSITDIGVVEGNEGVEEESPPRPPAQEPGKRDNVVSGEGDEN